MMAADQSDFRARYQAASSAFRVAAPSPLARIGVVLLAIVAVGLAVVLGAISLIVGGIVIVIAAIAITAQSLLARLRGRDTAPRDKRINVRVIKHEDQP